MTDRFAAFNTESLHGTLGLAVSAGTDIFGELSPRTLRDQIAAKVRQAILTGSLGQGERLVERRLAERFGASLTAVREALIELEAQGLVVRKRNSATHVVKLTPEDVDSIFRVRRALESLVVEEASRNATPDQKRQLRGVYGAMKDAAQADASRTFDDRILEFHRCLWDTADNSYLVSVLERTVLPYFMDRRLRTLSRPALPTQQAGTYYERVLNSHQGIVEAIEAGDPEGARAAFNYAFDGWYRRALEQQTDLLVAAAGA